MLRILDARTGEPVTATPARRGLTRIEAHASGLDPTALRVLVTADLLVRALELGGTPVWTSLFAPRQQAELRAAATTLGIRPLEDGRDLAAGLGEAQAIHVVAEDTGRVHGNGPVALVAPVTWTGTPRPTPAPDPASPATRTDASPADRTEEPADSRRPLSALLSDPAALRLALLSVPRGETVLLDDAVLDGAARQLSRWRRAVAEWARQPSRPVPEEVRTRLRTAWEDDLDLPGVLAVLRDVETAPDLPAGARFETYVYADRLLALDLPRDIGSAA
ncbi:hypothetical protein ACGFT2_00400 [Streptomyces sp. NPDC048514]|uniref:hypothetical protein n=1 Tax=Streptomyces sp. NPDC048514 TaxID=3365564 RepID=UPI003715259B